MDFQEYIIHSHTKDGSQEGKRWRPVVTTDNARMLGLELELPEKGLPHGVFYVPYFSVKAILWKMHPEGAQYSQSIEIRIAENSVEEEGQLGYVIFGYNLKPLADAIAQENVSHIYWGEDVHPSKHTPAIASIKRLTKVSALEEEEMDWDDVEGDYDEDEPKGGGLTVTELDSTAITKLAKHFGV